MFRKRSGQKPGEGFYMDFKRSYTQLPLATDEVSPTAVETLGAENSTTQTGSSLLTSSHYETQEESKDPALDLPDDWKMDHPFLESENYVYNAYWPPTPALGSGSLYQTNNDYIQSLAHGFNMESGLETPLSRPITNSDFNSMETGSLTMNDFLNSQSQYGHPPTMFEHGFQVTHNQPESLQQSRMPLSTEHQAFVQEDFQDYATNHSISEIPTKFRFRVTLLTATAMIKNANEIPLTYLNKCQTYKLSIRDAMPPQHNPGTLTRYRTSVRISFDDEQQRERPGHCWQLWKEGRGMNEAHQRGGKLQAVEFVPLNQSSDRACNVEVSAEAFDGFCVLWTPSSVGVAECELQVRFNFLSTDFSHSKGVKGIPVRLCTKTEVISSSSASTSAPSAPHREVSYCKVKLFRDHGAERKISNDEAHVKKQVEKLSQQINQNQSTITEGGKRRRSDSVTGNTRPNKAPKHKRASSISSVSSNGVRDGAEDDLHGKLASLSAMLRSRKAESLLFLEGDAQDDPDLYPVTLQGPTQAFAPTNSPEHQRLERRSTQMTGTSGGSPTLSTASMTSDRRQTSALQCPTPYNESSRLSSNEGLVTLRRPSSRADMYRNPQHLASPPEAPSRIHQGQRDNGINTTEWIEALGVDDNYQAPSTTVARAVACFYVQPRFVGKQADDAHYRAIYIRQRTARDFIEALARKCNVASALVKEMTHINSKGLRIMVDDDVILEMVEGQNMQADFDPIHIVKDENSSNETEGLDTSSTSYNVTLHY